MRDIDILTKAAKETMAIPNRLDSLREPTSKEEEIFFKSLIESVRIIKHIRKTTNE